MVKIFIKLSYRLSAFFFLFVGYMMMAQNIAVDIEIKKIDSLIEYNTFDVAQRKIDSLYKQLNTTQNRKRYKAQLLEIQYQ